MAEFTEVMKIKKRMHKEYVVDMMSCINCPLGIENNGKEMSCIDLREEYPEEYERICLEWAKEHPITRRKDKFKEVFGFEPDINRCPRYNSSFCNSCSTYGHDFCVRDWWNEEYKAPEEVE